MFYQIIIKSKIAYTGFEKLTNFEKWLSEAFLHQKIHLKKKM